MTLLERLVDRLEAIRFDALPAPVVAKTRACVADALACAFGGAQLPATVAATTLARERAGEGPATVWLAGDRRAPQDAAFANSAAAHSIIQEDMHAASFSHPGSVVVPAAVAVAEAEGAGGAALVEAIVVGYEAMAKVGALAATPEFLRRGFRASGVFGPFGAAAAAARLLGADAEQTLAALALAANFAGGLTRWAHEGSAEIYFENANAARCGVQAAELALQGLAGPRAVLEGEHGFLGAYAGGVPEEAAAWPGTGPLEIESVYFKPFASCAFTQEATEAARRLVRAHGVDARDVVGARVRAYAQAKLYPGCDYEGPFLTPTHCQLSNHYAVAAVLVDGDLTLAGYLRFDRPEVEDLARRVSVEIDPEAERLYPARKVATVELDLADGRTLSERVDDLAYPDEDAVFGKLAANAEAALGADGAARLVEHVARLESLASAGDLAECLRVRVG